MGKSGLSSFKFLKKKNDVFLYDDHLKKIQNVNLKKKIINTKNILKTRFDQIIISPGINIDKCKLSKFLKKKSK